MLLDHFHPPLKERRRRELFHSGWAVDMAPSVKRIPPGDDAAEPNAQFGIEIDSAGVCDPRDPGDRGDRIPYCRTA